MTDEPASTPCDGPALALSVRRLARQAHRLLNDPSPDPAEFRSLLRRITRLQEAVREPSNGPVSRWVDVLREQVESHPDLEACDGPRQPAHSGR